MGGKNTKTLVILLVVVVAGAASIVGIILIKGSASSCTVGVYGYAANMTFSGSYTLLVRLACLHSRKTEDASATHLECCDKRARSKSFSLSGMLYSPYRVNGKKRSSCQSRKGSQFSREEGILVRAAHSHPLRR